MVTADYKANARQFLMGDIWTAVTDLDYAGHPPGYSMFLAVLFALFGDSNAAVQITQVVFDCLATVLMLLIATELFDRKLSIVAGLLGAISPQFANYSLLLLPDTLAVVPILLAIYLILCGRRRASLVTLIIAGAGLGLSCWLRANALLLPPFVAAAVLLTFPRGCRRRYAGTVVLSAIAVIAPLTIKNFIAYKRFIPVSLGAGQKLLEGIAEYDQNGRFGIPRTDLGIMRQEAQMYQRPDYGNALFGEDGVNRDRQRVARGLAVIRAHPFWYLRVMARRAITFFRMARVPIVSADPPVTHSLEFVEHSQPVESHDANDLIARGERVSFAATISLNSTGQRLQLRGDELKYGPQFISGPFTLRRRTDYLLRLPIRLEQGRMRISLENEQKQLLASRIIDIIESKLPGEQPLRVVAIPFVSGNSSQIRIVFSNEGSNSGPPVAEIERVELVELGPMTFLWTRYPRFLIRNLQKFFVTVWIIPFATIGVVLLVLGGRWRTALILLTVPLYYFCIQSALHTERRYVIALHYFVLIIAAFSIKFVLVRLGGGGLSLFRGLVTKNVS